MPAGPAACGTNFCPLTLLTLLVKPAPPNANNAPTFPRIAPHVQPGDIYTCQSANAYYNAPLNITTMYQLGNAHPAHPPASTAQAQAQQASPALCASLAYSSQLTSTAPLPAHLSAPQLTSTIVTSAPNARTVLIAHLPAHVLSALTGFICTMELASASAPRAIIYQLPQGCNHARFANFLASPAADIRLIA